MIPLGLKSGGSVALATVSKGTTLQSLITSKITSLGREVRKITVDSLVPFLWLQDKEDPFYAVDLGRLLDLHDIWRECLANVQPYYAVKCNSDPALLQTLACLGCGFDCASKVNMVCVCIPIRLTCVIPTLYL